MTLSPPFELYTYVPNNLVTIFHTLLQNVETQFFSFFDTSSVLKVHSWGGFHKPIHAHECSQLLKLSYQNYCSDCKSACAAARNLMKNKIPLLSLTIRAFINKKMQKTAAKILPFKSTS